MRNVVSFFTEVLSEYGAKEGLRMGSFDLVCAKVAEALQLMNEAPELVKALILNDVIVST